MSTEIITVDGETGEVVDDLPALPQQPSGALNLFGASPAAALQSMSEVAKLLTDVLRQQHLYATIQGKNHVTVEGWTLLGSLLGVFPVVVSTERITEPAEGYKARVEARTLTGQVVGAGEALCTRAEAMWSFKPPKGKPRDDFALMAMAQTRATSRALRNPLGFVVKMAGYETAGAEEMPAQEPAQPISDVELFNAERPKGARPVVADTVTDYVVPEALRSDVAALLISKEGKTTVEAAAWVEAHIATAADPASFLQRAKDQLEAKPDRAGVA
jgi:hypothetical protein